MSYGKLHKEEILVLGKKSLTKNLFLELHVQYLQQNRSEGDEHNRLWRVITSKLVPVPGQQLCGRVIMQLILAIKRHQRLIRCSRRFEYSICPIICTWNQLQLIQKQFYFIVFTFFYC